jgi:hypothetical protein
MAKSGKFLALAGILVLLLGFPLGSFAYSSDYSQNFNALNDGNLSGQDSWTKLQGDGNYYIYNPGGGSDGKAAEMNFTGNGTTNKTYRAIPTIADGNDGQLTFAYWNDTGTETRSYIRLLHGSTVIYSVSFDIPNSGNSTSYYSPGGEINYDYVVGNLAKQNWGSFTLQWRASDHKMRLQRTGFAYSNWSDLYPANPGLTCATNCSIDGIQFEDYFNEYGYKDRHFFDTIDVGTTVPPPPASVFSAVVTSPLANSTTTPAFGDWGLNFQYFTATTTPVSFRLHLYVQPPGAPTYQYDEYSDVTGYIPNSTTTWPWVMPRTVPLSFNGTWTLLPSITTPDNATQLTTATTTYAFTVTGAPSGAYAPPYSTTSALTITCDPSSGWFAQSLCNLATFLFIPSQDSLIKFSGIWDLIKAKPPVGYLTQSISTVTADLTNSTTTAPTGSSAIIDLGSGFDDFRTGMSAVMWIWALFAIIHRIKHLEL